MKYGVSVDIMNIFVSRLVWRTVDCMYVVQKMKQILFLVNGLK